MVHFLSDCGQRPIQHFARAFSWFLFISAPFPSRDQQYLTINNYTIIAGNYTTISVVILLCILRGLRSDGGIFLK
jgi:hypothetical protein